MLMNNNQQNMRLMWCHVGKAIYGLPVEAVRSIQRMPPLRLNQESERPFGWLPTTSGELPVMSLAHLFNLKAHKSLRMQRVVILSSDAGMWGLLVDHVAPTTMVSADSILPLPALALHTDQPYFRQMVQQGETLYPILHLPALHPHSTPVVLETAIEIDAQPSVDSTLTDDPKLFMCQLLGREGVTVGLSSSQVTEVARVPTLLHLPGTPSSLVGFVRWRDKTVVPVIDLAQRLGFSPLQTRSLDEFDRLIITRALGSSHLLGFLARPSVKIVPLPVRHRPIPPEYWPTQTNVRGVVTVDDQLVIIPEPTVFSAN